MKEYINFRRENQSISFLKRQVNFSGNAFLPQKAFVPILVNEMQAIPVVTFGQYVEEGQLIARAKDKFATNIHSPIPGIVGDVINFQTDYGDRIGCLPILLEGRFEILGKQVSKYTWRNTSVLELARIIESSGLIITQNPFIPLATKLLEIIRLGLKNMQVALFDFDKSCGLESYLLEYFFFEVMEGFAILAKIIDCKRLEFFYLKNIDTSIKEKIVSLFDFTEVVFTRTKNNYPFYDITTKTKQEAFVVLPSTALYTYEAIVKNRPFVSSYILLTGSAIKTPKLLKARLGTPIGNLIEECGGVTTHPTSIVINGFLEGVLTESFDIPVNKTIKSIAVVPEKMLERVRSFNCNSCGICRAACPMHLNPAMLIQKIKRRDYTKSVLLQLKACIKCKVCSSCCECRIQVSSIITKAKEELGL